MGLSLNVDGRDGMGTEGRDDMALYATKILSGGKPSAAYSSAPR